VSESSTTTDRGSASPKKGAGKPSLWARITLFLRQMVAELRKVIWPTRKELITYTWVVIIFVAVVTAIVGVFDLVFTRLVLQIFG
jgi:preprotein translocase subunit SecE